MKKIVDYPLVLFVFSFIGLWLSAFAGDFFRKRRGPLEKDERQDFGICPGRCSDPAGPSDWIHFFNGYQPV
jgi:hypothetical protein